MSSTFAQAKAPTKLTEKSDRAISLIAGEVSRATGSPINNILLLQRTIGNQSVRRLVESGRLQAKLKISQPNDVCEQEADRVAHSVMHTSDGELKRQYAEGNGIQFRALRNKATQFGRERDFEESSRTPSGSGQGLSESTKAFFEPRLGFDFRHARIHADAEADLLNRSLSANAFTFKQDIFFRNGYFNPDSPSGQEILAHELAHVMQQENNDSVQRKVASDYKTIKSDLSYGIFDWVITDREAHQVLVILSGLSEDDLLDTVQQMRRDKIFERLLSNVSDADKSDYAELLSRIKGIQQQIKNLPECCQKVLKRIDIHIASAKALRALLGAAPFMTTLGHHPADLALHLLMEHWDVWRESIRSVDPILKGAVYEEIVLHLLEHQNKHPEEEFWSKMEQLWQ